MAVGTGGQGLTLPIGAGILSQLQTAGAAEWNASHDPTTGMLKLPPIKATIFALTHPGRTRDHNEDTFLVADLDNTEADRSSKVRERVVGERGLLCLVADGMGGAAAGELASEMAAVQIHRHLIESWTTAPITTAEGFTVFLREAVERANSELHQYALNHPDVRGMGTTATVVGIWNAMLYIAQIGDSRGYLIRDGEAHQLTRDQSLTQRLVEAGELTEQEAQTSERRNIILQALGPEADVKVDLSSQSLQRGDLLLLCSDGLTTVVGRDDISAAAGGGGDVKIIAEKLIELANQRGGPDNITVVLARFDGEGLPDRAADDPGYHEYRTGPRPALQATAAFPAPPSEDALAETLDLPPQRLRTGRPAGWWLALIGTGLVLLGLGFWLWR